ncbi:hypothetical protein H9L10_12275 [Phycicoccus endophyticus]|uniref:Uncharacterized protein n=1 Tax=Phycicoccus endophyticus TaxID=1690220 RepID=A0A7G9R090_9MICO|nr:hypothetical protein [Phycicoccus endophyticus]NHI20183.1 hypothetical protein [Phycicoccus endophyticus]QNN49015.1 hypothetical protein H9L10_12275 [Phycicoccus endophyticus]GGL44628.1 hypothetical protein GCM10012283_29010 [Phycicoccus endophyticus]
MTRPPHENVATVLVDPAVLAALEVSLMHLDLRVWPMATAPICADGPRQAFQYRRRMLEARRGAWDHAAHWVPVWVSFGASWREGEEPLPWAAHAALWEELARWSGHVHYRKWLTGVPPLRVPVGPDGQGASPRTTRRG